MNNASDKENNPPSELSLDPSSDQSSLENEDSTEIYDHGVGSVVEGRGDSARRISRITPDREGSGTESDGPTEGRVGPTGRGTDSGGKRKRYPTVRKQQLKKKTYGTRCPLCNECDCKVTFNGNPLDCIWLRILMKQYVNSKQ